MLHFLWQSLRWHKLGNLEKGIKMRIVDMGIIGMFSMLCVNMAIAEGTREIKIDEADPTVVSGALAQAHLSKLIDYKALGVSALVVGVDNDGIAILSADPKLTSGKRQIVVRAGMVVPLNLNNVSYSVKICNVSENGVEIEDSLGDKNLLVPVGFKPLNVEVKPGVNMIRYISCNKVPLELCMSMISDQTGLNISISEKAARSEVSLFLRNIPAITAVEEICRTKNLWFREDTKSGIVRILTMDEYQAGLSSFREEETEAFTLLYPNVIEIASVIYGLYPERVYLTLGDKDILDDEVDDLSRRMERFDIMDSASSTSLLSIDPGTSTKSFSSGSGVGVFDGISENKNLSELRKETERFTGISADLAADIESSRKKQLLDSDKLHKLLEIHREKAPSIFVTVSRRNNMIVVRTSDSQVMDEIRSLIKRLDVATPSVLLEMRILEISLDDGYTSSFDYEFNTTRSIKGKDYKGTGGFPGLSPISTSARTDTMTFQILSENFSTRIQLLEKEGKAKTLATPTLLIANNEISSFFIGEEVPITTGVTLEPVTGTVDGMVTTIGYTVEPKIDVTPIGTHLLITPNINADRSVTLRLLQTESTRNIGGGTIPYGNTERLQSYSVDTIVSRKISGTFITQDGLIAAIGGLIKETESEQISRIPVLGRLPLVGFLFRSTEKVKNRTELVIIVRPHVITTPSESEAKTRALFDNLAPKVMKKLDEEKKEVR